MTLDEFIEKFPERPFAIRFIERGEQYRRKFVWYVMFTSDYFTSDSDRAVLNHCPPNDPEGFGDSLELALDDLRNKLASKLQRAVSDHRELLKEAEGKLREFEK